MAQHEDIDRVMRMLDEIGQELSNDPDWQDAVLEPTEVVGVISLGESSIDIRTITRTLPLKQWDVANELRRRIVNRFDEEGIETPFPYRTLTWSDQSIPLTVRLELADAGPRTPDAD